jgi:hypothetical protein
MNAKGDTPFVWEHAGSNLEMRASMRPAGGTFSNPPLELSDDGAVPAVAINAAGDVFLAWRDYRGGVDWAPAGRATRLRRAVAARPGRARQYMRLAHTQRRPTGTAVELITRRLDDTPRVLLAQRGYYSATGVLPFVSRRAFEALTVRSPSGGWSRPSAAS